MFDRLNMSIFAISASDEGGSLKTELESSIDVLDSVQMRLPWEIEFLTLTKGPIFYRYISLYETIREQKIYNHG